MKHNGNGNGNANLNLPPPPSDDASMAERLSYCENGISYLIADRGRIHDSLSGLADEQAEQRGILLRVESITLTLAAKLETHFRESSPPSVEQLQIIRTQAEKTARELRSGEKKAIRIETTMGDLSRRIEKLEDDVKDTQKTVAVSQERAIEILKDQRDSAVELVVETREKIETKVEKREERQEHAKEASKGRLYDFLKSIGVPMALLLVGFVSAKLSGCTGVHPVPVPVVPTAQAAGH